jgi:5-methylthioadenosine/S-adenosylhomocysteine deaminase
MDTAPALPANELTDLYRHLIERWHKSGEGRIHAGISCSAPQRVTVEYFEALEELSKTHGLPFYVHILETKLQRVLGEEKFGKSLIRYVSELGFLSERSNVIHAIWIDDDDIETLANSGASVAHNPVCNLRLGSGVMPFRKLIDSGVAICLGSDEAIADDTTNMWSVAKMVGLIHNITEPDYMNWPRASEILRCLVRGGARAMQQQRDVGILAPGYEADLIMIDLNTLAFTPLNDLRRQLVYCENGSSVRMTMVAGRVVVEEGHVLTVDEEAIKGETREIARAQASVAMKVREHAEQLAPFYRQMYLKAAKRDVGLNRWVGDDWRSA